uniref:Uncharacterized protein n=1 Tax=Cyprinus carpio TaxID=7962 RepID=A0A8C1YGA3_CYPCA
MSHIKIIYFFDLMAPNSTSFNGASLCRTWVWVGRLRLMLSGPGFQMGAIKHLENQSESTQSSASGLGRGSPHCPCGATETALVLEASNSKPSNSENFFVKMTCWALKTAYPINVGSGFCLVGNSGRDIDCMGFMFLNNIQSVVLCNVSYPTTEQVTPQVAVEEIKSVTYKKKTSVGQRQTVETTKKITKTNKWSMSENITATFKVDVKAGIPDIAEVSTGFSTSRLSPVLTPTPAAVTPGCWSTLSRVVFFMAAG